MATLLTDRVRSHLEALGLGDVAPHPILDAVEAAGAARSQSEYADWYARVFDSLDEYEDQLDTQRFLGGSEPSADDWSLFVVLVRFDPILHGLYKLNRQRMVEFRNLGGWVRDLAQRSGVMDTFDLRADADAIYAERTDISPKGVAPRGLPDLWAPHDRDRFDREARRLRATQESGHEAFRGEFIRGQSAHRDWITRDGVSGFKAEPDRYHLIVADNCPWCHRVALTRAILGLQDVISMDHVYYRRDPDRGWQFRPDIAGFDRDSLFGAQFVTEIYERVGSTEKSLPLLWDRQTQSVVNNESAEIIRMLDQGFRDFTDHPELAPVEHLEEIESVNAWIYQDINNGAYKAGFTRSADAYRFAFDRFFAAFDRLERIFAERRWLCGDRLTEADVRLYPTMFRFDPVYYIRMGLNRTMVRDTVHLKRWLADLGQVRGVAEASFIDRCKNGYFGRHGNEIVPIGPF